MPPRADTRTRRLADSQTRLIFAEHFAAYFLGEKWLEQHFRSFKGTTPEGSVRFKYVLWRLGRLLFDLQSFEWFDELVENLRRRNLAGALFEAEVARLLMQLPVTTALRMPSGEKGQDYDIDLGGAALTVAVEAKAKDDDTPYSAATVKNTFNEARRQLPKEGLGLIFMRIPLSWTRDGNYESEIDALISGLLRNTSRVQAVVLIWDELAATTATTMRFEPRQRVLRRFDAHPDVGQMLHFLEQTWASVWDVVGPASAQ